MKNRSEEKDIQDEVDAIERTAIEIIAQARRRKEQGTRTEEDIRETLNQLLDLKVKLKQIERELKEEK